MIRPVFSPEERTKIKAQRREQLFNSISGMDEPGVIEVLQRARQHVCDLASGRKKFTMSIPADHQRDSDLIICDALDAALAEIRHLRGLKA